VDTLRLEISEIEVPAWGLIDSVDIFVNDRNLVDIVREVELPFAARDGKPRLAGTYIGLPAEDVFLPSPRLLGEPVKFYDYDSSKGKIAVLGCGCGDVGCWPFRVRIELREDVVIRDGFEQPHRLKWRYDEMRPFVFDWTQYFSALDRGAA
jgi:hypothetical protein